MRTALDPNDTLVRLLRGAVHSASPGRVAGIRATAPSSSIAAAAAALRRPPSPRAHAADRGVSIDDAPAAVFRFHAADAMTIIRAMIAASAADGEIDAGENRRILDWLRLAGGTPEDEAFVLQQETHPAAVEDLARGVTQRETAVEIYAASLLATGAATDGSRRFLRQLAAALRLDPPFIAALHASWSDPPP
jgi:uncharacterized membrane protein YebE (DUF533 family)